MSAMVPSKLWDGVLGVLAAHDFRDRGAGFDRRPLIESTNSLGGPAMRLLHWRSLVELGRIPRSDEGKAIDAIKGIDAFGAPTVEVFMVEVTDGFVHRLTRPCHILTTPMGTRSERSMSFPSGEDNGFFISMGLPEIYYWIDYSCMNQENTADAVPLLPLWVAACERFLRIETEDYDERAWCRVEPLLSYVFSFADHHNSIGLEFRCQWPYSGEEAKRPILDPRRGKLTKVDDMKLILPLVDLATRIRPANTSRDDVRLDESVVKCYRL